ncbi:hypothetical protein GOP47_0024430 [Adiantum capillus-veneris]|uniref:Uncharacterized protein n=1 Tax=Adiantum capillus-veneris TaxID=13818 RepID=A0A9D4Z3N3_ADICA|nr:hypothetical protein GOP47_0024430 [Adiantum capillus-veneris]
MFHQQQHDLISSSGPTEAELASDGELTKFLANAVGSVEESPDESMLRAEDHKQRLQPPVCCAGKCQDLHCWFVSAQTSMPSVLALDMLLERKISSSCFMTCSGKCPKLQSFIPSQKPMFLFSNSSSKAFQ